MICCALATVCAVPAYAQDVASPAAAIQTPVEAACCILKSGTLISVEVVDRVSSATAKIDAMFAIRLHAPIVVDGAEIVPAGTSGMGQIVHAAKSRMGGKAGELILAARYLDVAGTRIPLRAFRIGGAGKDNSTLSMATTAVAGPVGFLISGGNKHIEAGTIAEAKVAADTRVVLPIGTGEPLSVRQIKEGEATK